MFDMLMVGWGLRRSGSSVHKVPKSDGPNAEIYANLWSCPVFLYIAHFVVMETIVSTLQIVKLDCARFMEMMSHNYIMSSCLLVLCFCAYNLIIWSTIVAHSGKLGTYSGKLWHVIIIRNKTKWCGAVTEQWTQLVISELSVWKVTQSR